MTSNITEKLEKRISDLEQRVEKLQNTLAAVYIKDINRKIQEKMSINEFLKTKKLKDGVKLTLAIAYWLDHVKKEGSINVSDLEKAFRAARLPVPKNINDKVNMNIKNGHMADDKEKKEGKKTWYVTNSGAELMKGGLNK